MVFGFGKKKQELTGLTQREDLDEAGVKVTADERLELRTGLLKAFEEDLEKIRKEITQKGDKVTPEELINSLEKMLYLVDGKVRQVAVAWGRSGTDRRFAICMIAWEKLVAFGFANIDSRKTIIKVKKLFNSFSKTKEKVKEDKEREELMKGMIVQDNSDKVRKCKHSINFSWLPYGLMIIDFSFKELDVTTLKNIVIHSVTPPQSQYAYPRYDGYSPPAGSVQEPAPKMRQE